jgi:hypothetical protein
LTAPRAKLLDDRVEIVPLTGPGQISASGDRVLRDQSTGERIEVEPPD